MQMKMFVIKPTDPLGFFLFLPALLLALNAAAMYFGAHDGVYSAIYSAPLVVVEVM